VKIAVASGKGGTGKTTVATSLLGSLLDTDEIISPSNLIFMDCDVEAPNAHLFLNPEFSERKDVHINIPQVDEQLCSHCGLCAEICQFNAIAVIGKKALVFPQLCHGCGSCTLMCPEKAISETENVIGYIEKGAVSQQVRFAHGYLNVGEPMAIPIIGRVKGAYRVEHEDLIILDASPGTSCPVVETMRGTDFVVLVTEPTPFGLHDLKLAVEVAQTMNIPMGVIINRSNIGDDAVEDFCHQMNIPILMTIPYEKRIAEGIAVGKLLIDIDGDYVERFRQVYSHIAEIVTAREGRINHA